MKKAILNIGLVAMVIAAIAVIHYANNSPQAPDTQTAPSLDFDVPVGEAITVELKYRGVSGRDDDLRAYGGYGFGGDASNASPFITDVAQQTDNRIYAVHNPWLTDQPYSAVEYKDRDIIAFYFDLDGNGKLSEPEKLKPASVSRENQRGDNNTVFLTPDFTVTDQEGRKTPFRVILWAEFYANSDIPSVMWWPMGVYEGTFTLSGEKMKLYLFPDFNTKSYTAFGRSNYALVSADYKNNGYVPQNSLSQLIVKDQTYYRLAAQPQADGQRVFVRLAEDKTPRGKIAFDIQADAAAGCVLNNATLQSPGGSHINFTFLRDMHEVPVGDYTISSGYMIYGPNSAFSTSFGSLPKFTVKTGETAAIAMGKPTAAIRAVEQNRRYNSDKEYKTKFAEDTPVYIDVAFTGIAGETYRGFRQTVQKENYTTSEYIKARLAIADSENNTIVSQQLEPG